MLKLVKRIRAECPGKDIWVWTGYKLDELNAQQMEVVDLINVLVDGKVRAGFKRPGAHLARQQQTVLCIICVDQRRILSIRPYLKNDSNSPSPPP